MASKAIFIGLGGSGGATLHHIYNELDLRLREHGWLDGVPQAWQFLHVDVPSECGNESTVDLLRDADHYLPLARYREDYRDFVRTLKDKPNITGGWMPAPEAVSATLYEGAGQARAVGRVLILDNAERLQSRIKEMLKVLKSPSTTEELSKLGKKMNDSVSEDKVDVWLITSLGGGSGSGMFLDVSLILHGLKNIDEALQTHLTVAYPADVFDSLDDNDTSGVRPNTLAAISEMTSVYFGSDKISESESEVLKLAGTPQGDLNRNRGPLVTFVQGSSNGTITLGTPNEVFHSTARTIVALQLDAEIRDNFRTHVLGNPRAVYSPDELVPPRMRLNNSRESQPASSFGYASVTLGRDLFANYAADRLARSAIGQILELDEKAVKDRASDPERFRLNARRFAFECGLDEESNQQISTAIDAILDIDIDRDFDKDIRVPVESEMDRRRSGANVQPPELLKMQNEVTERMLREKNFMAARQASMQSQIAEWVTQQTKILMENAIRSIAKDGLDTTALYLEELGRQLVQQAADRRGALQFSTAASKKVSKTPSLRQESPKSSFLGLSFGKKAQKAMSGITDPLKEAFGALMSQLGLEWRKFSNDQYASLFAGFARGVVTPLRESLLDVKKSFAQQFDAKTKVKFASLPVKDVTPNYQPSPNDHVLGQVTGPGGFSDEFENLLERVLQQGPNDLFEEVQHRAWAEVLGGVDELAKGRFWSSDEAGDAKLCSLVTVKSWRPIFDASSDGGDLFGEPAQFRFNLSFSKILSNAREWVYTRKGVRSYVTQSLSEYLNQPGADGDARRQEFAIKLAIAIDHASPMVSLNDDVVRMLHKKEIGISSEVSKIPIGDDFEAVRAEIRNKLTSFEISNPESKFNTSISGGSVSVTRFLGAFVSPVTMDSVVRPIIEEVAVMTDANSGTRDFWTCRRARQLTSFVPLAYEVQKLIIQGWYVLRFLNVISDVQIEEFVSRGELSPISVPVERGTRKLPGLMLTRPQRSRQSDVLPLIMESFILALVQLASGSQEELDAFRSLSSIGENAERILSKAIRDGQTLVVEGTTVDFMPDSSQSERIGAVKTEIERRIADLERLKIQAGTPAWDLNEFNPTWEMREILIDALEGMRNTLEETAAGSARNA